MKKFISPALTFPALTFPAFPLAVALVVVLALAACQRNTFEYARTEAPKGAPAYTFKPDLNQPGVSKPAEATK
ncbi:MAG: hypothetical protein RL417_1463 [Pseudomonadota bacterium]|jgi:hypothetical protein